jgi:hypothetical protein
MGRRGQAPNAARRAAAKGAPAPLQPLMPANRLKNILFVRFNMAMKRT